MEKFQVGDDTHGKIPISAASRSRGDATQYGRIDLD